MGVSLCRSCAVCLVSLIRTCVCVCLRVCVVSMLLTYMNACAPLFLYYFCIIKNLNLDMLELFLCVIVQCCRLRNEWRNRHPRQSWRSKKHGLVEQFTHTPLTHTRCVTSITSNEALRPGLRVSAGISVAADHMARR